MPDRMLTTGEAAEMTGYCVRTICSWFDRGLITGHRVPGSLFRRISYRSLRILAERTGMPLEPLKEKPCKTRATQPSPNSQTES